MDDLHLIRIAAQASRDADDVADQRRAARNALIFDVLSSQNSPAQVDVCRESKLTREHIRRIVDAERARRGTAGSDK